MTTASIVTYKSDREELNRLLSCVEGSAIERVYIVDNSPTDELRDLGGYSPKVEYIFGHGNIGYGAAHNIGIRRAIEGNAKYHVIINPDIYFETGVVEALTQYMDSHDTVGQLMPQVVYPDCSMQYLCKLLPTPMDLIARRFLPPNKFVEKSNSTFEMRQSGYHMEMEVPYLSGCFMFCRVEALNATSGFSERYFMYCEDIDLCRRIGMAGFTTMYLPSVSIVHAHKKESFKSKKMLIAHVESAITYFNRWGWLFDSYRRKINKRASSQY